MAEFRKYKMNSPQDYRPNIEKHEVRLVRVIDGVDWAYGEFTVIDDDMLDVTEEEMTMVPKKEIPNITSRQCKEMLILTSRYNDVLAILDSLPNTTDEEKMQKLILENYWVNSQEFIRNHEYMGLITTALGMSSDEVDTFFITASKR